MHGGVPKAQRQRLDLLKPDPARVAPSGRRDPAKEDALDDRERRREQGAGVVRFAFYERAGKAFAIHATGERRHYGCFLFKKGVLPEE